MNVEQYAFDSIDRLRGDVGREAVVAELMRVMADFGFQTVMAAGMPRPGQSMGALVLSAHWPEGWMSRYMRKGYDHHDPTVKRVQGSLAPFRWSDTRKEPLSTKQARVMDEACEFGMVDGFVVPIHDYTGLEAGISFGTSKYVIDAHAEAALHLIAIYAYEMLRRRPAAPSDGGNVRTLSPRERECVQWVAAGKTAWEIGNILQISEDTVKKYLRSASEKTNARTRPQLVAKCLRDCLIS